MTKVDAIGAATRMQGYAARPGLGITRIRNQTIEPIPRMGNITFEQKCLFRVTLHVFFSSVFGVFTIGLLLLNDFPFVYID
jgi:hypothetical protein